MMFLLKKFRRSFESCQMKRNHVLELGPPTQWISNLNYREILTLRASPTTSPTTMSSAALNKIAPNSPSRQSPSEIETSIANALYDLESNIPDMKAALRPLQFVSAREVR